MKTETASHNGITILHINGRIKKIFGASLTIPMSTQKFLFTFWGKWIFLLKTRFTLTTETK